MPLKWVGIFAQIKLPTHFAAPPFIPCHPARSPKRTTTNGRRLITFTLHLDGVIGSEGVLQLVNADVCRAVVKSNRISFGGGVNVLVESHVSNARDCVSVNEEKQRPSTWQRRVSWASVRWCSC